MSSFFALTFRGLEPVAAREIAALPSVAIQDVGYRRVAFTADSLAPLLTLRAVDDLFLHVATWDGIARPRETLKMLTTLSARLDLLPALAACAQAREIHEPPAFSVTASFVGKRNYTTDEIKQSVSYGIAQSYGWRYTTDDADADLNLRLFIEHETVWVGVRLAGRPLHDRAYVRALQQGALKPPVAAAMLHLAQVSVGSRVLDPCCGSGTILLEAALIGARPFGGDLDPTALAHAVVGTSIPLVCWDAQTLPLASHSVDCLVSNLPWGRQVVVDGALESFYAAVCREITRIASDSARVVLLTSVPQLVALPALRLQDRIEISLFGQTPTILLFSK